MQHLLQQFLFPLVVLLSLAFFFVSVSISETTEDTIPIFLVRNKGLEPSHLAIQVPKTNAMRFFLHNRTSPFPYRRQNI